mgnify:CR=1 FL=1
MDDTPKELLVRTLILVEVSKPCNDFIYRGGEKEKFIVNLFVANIENQIKVIT